MVFNTITFLLFYLIFFNLYWLINNKSSIRNRNLLILVGSYLFYGWWDWRFLSLIIISSIGDYYFGSKIHYAKSKSKRKVFLIGSLILNLGILGFFKYFDFFIESLEEILSFLSVKISIHTLKVILPVGISFYTFQTMSYTIDIYRKSFKPSRDIIAFFAFVSFFPQLVAGPIERASNLLPQFLEKKTFNYYKSIESLRYILWGLFKKIVIADNLAVIVENIFNTSNSYSGGVVLLGTLLFGFQIYCDFSGYSDIAMGTSKMLGFDLMVNFKTPYLSSSLGEFWKRWHISLSSWFRDYVYIPLGGNKKSKLRVEINILLTFLLSGLWHGAAFTFIIWGFLHGTALILEKRIKIKIGKQVSMLLTFIFTMLLWLPFRAENMDHLKQLVLSLFHFNNFGSQIISILQLSYSTYNIFSFCAIFILFAVVECITFSSDFNNWIGKCRISIRYFIYYMLIISIIFLGNYNVKPFFIYFQF